MDDIKKIQIETLSVTSLTSRIISTVITHISEEIEEMNVMEATFRRSMTRSVEMIVNAAYKKSEKSLVFPNIIPGFTTMIIKKLNYNLNEVEISEVERDPKNEMKELDLVNNILTKFFKKSNNSKVLVIENQDMIFAFLPVADIRKNLKDLELYTRE